MSQSDPITRSQNGNSQSNSEPALAARLLDPEVRPRAKHRHFTAEYKRRILREIDACTEPGQQGALLRREGLYSSLISKWRQQAEQAALHGLAPKKRGRKPHPEAAELARLRRQNERLQAQLKRAEIIIEFQKKLADLLGIPRDPPSLDEPSE